MYMSEKGVKMDVRDDFFALAIIWYEIMNLKKSTNLRYRTFLSENDIKANEFEKNLIKKMLRHEIMNIDDIIIYIIKFINKNFYQNNKYYYQQYMKK